MNNINTVDPIKDAGQLKELITYIDKRYEKMYGLILRLGLYSGLRVSDILNLTVEDIQDKSVIKVRELKTGKLKVFPVKKELKTYIKDYLETDYKTKYILADKHYIFIGKKHCKLDRSQVYRVLNRACTVIGIKANIGTHTMRKTFGYHFYKQTHDIVTLQKILNHSSPAITLKYVGIESEEISTAYNNFDYKVDGEYIEKEPDQVIIDKQAKEIKELKDMVKLLTEQLAYSNNRMTKLTEDCTKIMREANHELEKSA